MMNIKLFLAGLCALASFALPESHANTIANTPAAATPAVSGKVGEALVSLPVLTGAYPRTSARYYIYLCSASWCGPCNREMPHVVKAYEEMKKSGLVELVMVNVDKTEEAARAFLEKYGATFPATASVNGARLPGFANPRGIPYAIIVDADGNLVKRGHGSIIGEWKKVITDYEKEKGLGLSFPESLTLTYSPRKMWAEVDAEKDHGDEEANVLIGLLRKIKWFNAKPNRKAKYYIIVKMDRTSYKYTYTARRTLSSVAAEMPGLVKHHKDMKKDGRVELLFVAGDASPALTKACLSKEFKAKFPGAHLTDEEVHNLPGMGDMSRYFMSAVMVRASDGSVIKVDGSMKLVADWKNVMLEAEDAAETAGR